MRDGYNPKFLDEDNVEFHITLPGPSMKLQDDMLQPDGAEAGDFELKYIHYSLMMSKSTRQALFSAANVDNTKQKVVSGRKGRKWFVDPRIGRMHQIDNYAYKNSPWDRGHLTRRTAVTWGDSATALAASNDSCAYTNASLQHADFNEDEWRVPEKLVAQHDLAKNKKLNVITGSLFTSCDRFLTREIGDPPVRIPSGFWKIVSYINKNTNKLATDAYIFFQDKESLRHDHSGDRDSLQYYCTTTTEVAIWTGLEFDQKLYDSNSMMFSRGVDEDDAAAEGVEAVSVRKLREMLLGDHAPVLEAGIADHAAIASARKKMNLRNFYQLVEDVSWI